MFFKLEYKILPHFLIYRILMSNIERETIEIENAREIFAANESKANEVATKAQALKVECERDLAEAIPILEAATNALKTLNQVDISALKSMGYPPQGVRVVMEAVCLLLGEQPTKTSDMVKKFNVFFGWVLNYFK